jgi:hypothetical protein
MAILGLREYARQRGTSLSTVQKAISSGRISTLPNGMIDSDVADREWRENTEPRPKGSTKRQQYDEGEVSGATQYTKARAVREHFLARLAQLEFQERTGELVRASEVKIAAFNHSRMLRDRILAVPDRVASIVASESDAAKCHSILAEELRKALNEAADDAVSGA